MLSSDVYREVGEAAWSWVLSHVREAEGPWLPATVPEDGPPMALAEDRDSLYAGIAGLAPVLTEIAQYRALSDVEQVLSAGVVARLSAKASVRTEPSLYDGLAGDVAALKLLARGREQVALQRLADLMTPAGWNTTSQIDPGSDAPVADLVMGRDRRIPPPPRPRHPGRAKRPGGRSPRSVVGRPGPPAHRASCRKGRGQPDVTMRRTRPVAEVERKGDCSR